NTQDGIVATGFLAAGPWDYIGHAEVPESKIDGQIARLLDRDDMVSNTFNTFLSTTIQCARCHNHKFDPVTQTDYYRLTPLFSALDRTDRSYDLDPNVAKRRAELDSRRRDLLAAKKPTTEVDGELAKLPRPRIVYSGAIHTGSGTFTGTGANAGKPREIHVLARGD